VNGYLLDTNVVSELRKRDRVDRAVRQWFDSHSDGEFWLSVLVVGELRRGVELAARRDARTARALRGWLDSVVADFADRVLPIGIAVSERWARISVPDPLPVVDGLLAATALEHDLTLLTRNANDVARTGVALVDPFTER
jgi:predicted nucleic acid-binding protein